jgi:two-component system phosphate regulon sensor histidine kinase PhoR
LQVDLPPDSVVVDADRDAIADALVNLLTNALKYGGEPARVSVFVTAQAREVRICVSDNGPGIVPTEHKRIFQKFYRVDDRLSAKREGSGLGLAIVKHVMRAHRGRVELESTPGRGSTFSLVLPAARTDAA